MPTISAPGHAAGSWGASAWVGIDGLKTCSTDAILQAGIDLIIRDGVASYKGEVV